MSWSLIDIAPRAATAGAGLGSTYGELGASEPLSLARALPCSWGRTWDHDERFGADLKGMNTPSCEAGQ
jgi:hypothetical protein